MRELTYEEVLRVLKAIAEYAQHYPEDSDPELLPLIDSHTAALDLPEGQRFSDLPYSQALQIQNKFLEQNQAFLARLQRMIQAGFSMPEASTKTTSPPEPV